MYFIKDYNPKVHTAIVSDMSYGESDQLVDVRKLPPELRSQIIGVEGTRIKLGINLLVDCLTKAGVPRHDINPMLFGGQHIVQVSLVSGNTVYKDFAYQNWSGGVYPSVAICADDTRNMLVVAQKLGLMKEGH